jgi:sigma-E factor negative regulatory protein RseA
MKENLSAFIDNELDERTSEQILDRLHSDGDLRDEFALQVMIGDVLRGDTFFDARFTASVMSRLDDEPTVLAPGAFRVQPEAKRLWMPAAAAVAGVALVSWLGLDFMPAPADVQPQLAVAPAVVPAQPAQNESPLRAYLVAHQGYSPTGSMQGVALYARGVSDPQTDDHR